MPQLRSLIYRVMNPTMSKVHISTPELEKCGISYEEFYRVLFVIVKHKAHHLRVLHPSQAIENIQAYPLIIIDKIIKLFETLHTVITYNKDYVASNILLRSLADQISSLLLIYSETDEEIKALRHYLFIIDGIKGRLNQLTTEIPYDGKIKSEEFEALKTQIKSAIDNYNGAYTFSIAEISKLSINTKHSTVIAKLIKECNWRFKSLSSTKTNTYKWKELYAFLKLPIDSAFFSLLSEFVHGLSTSNLIFEDNDITSFEAISSIGASLLGKLDKTIDLLFSEEVPLIKPLMISALTDPFLPQTYIDYIKQTI